MKKVAAGLLLILSALFAVFLIVPRRALAAENAGNGGKETADLGLEIDEQLSTLDADALEEYLASLDEETRGVFGSGTVKEQLKALLQGDMKLEYGSMMNYLLHSFFGGIAKLLPVFASIAAIAVFSGLAECVRPGFLSEGNRNVVFFVCFSAILVLLLAFAFRAVGLARDSVQRMTRLMDALFPVLLTLMAASGGTASVAVCRPAVAFLAAGISEAVLSFVLPVTALIMLFSAVGNLSPSVKLNRFGDFFRSCNKWVIGLSVTVFTLFLSVQGIAAAHFDGISLRAAKYAIGNSVPIVGGFLRDGFDLVLAGSVLIKNAAGAWGVAAIFAAVLFPVLQIAAFSLFLRLTAALIEPVSDARIPAFLGSLSGAVNYLTASVLAVGFLFFLTLMLLVSATGAIV